MTGTSSSLTSSSRNAELVPVGPNSLTFRAIAQARTEKRLVRLLLERQSRGETGRLLYKVSVPEAPRQV